MCNLQFFFLLERERLGRIFVTADQTLLKYGGQLGLKCPTRNGLKNGEVTDTDLCLGLL